MELWYGKECDHYDGNCCVFQGFLKTVYDYTKSMNYALLYGGNLSYDSFYLEAELN